jgi:beta-lactamase regulating signal transducer with metallopeptidase domain
MIPGKSQLVRSLVLLFVLLPLFSTFGLNSNFTDLSDARLHSINAQIATTSPSTTETTTATPAQSETPTATLPVGAATGTPTPSSTVQGTVLPTVSTTAVRSGTTTTTPRITTTLTPNLTNTPGPTETFVPLPSITLLFPVETVTSTPEMLSFDETSSTALPDEVSQDNPGRITARSVLLIGTILLLWVILAIFLIFYLQKIAK